MTNKQLFVSFVYKEDATFNRREADNAENI